jgi:copper chaperone
MNTIELNVQDMSCGSCVKHIKAALTPLAGVEAVEVDLDAGRVRVSGTPDLAMLLTTLDAAGYPAQLVAVAAAPGEQAGSAQRRGCCCSKTAA